MPRCSMASAPIHPASIALFDAPTTFPSPFLTGETISSAYASGLIVAGEEHQSLLPAYDAVPRRHRGSTLNGGKGKQLQPFRISLTMGGRSQDAVREP